MLRLWVAATDYANEMSLSQEILKRMSDSYRRMRNTVRFLLGNLHDFDPAQSVPMHELVALDRWAIGRTQALQQEIAQAYRDYAFHLIYQKVHNFCVVDLGGLYLDILKDRLYTLPAAARRGARRRPRCGTSPRASCAGWRRSCRSQPRRCGGTCAAHGPRSVFLTTWHELPALPAEQIDWSALIALRAAAARELERLRMAGEIGAPLDAELDVWCRRRSIACSAPSAMSCGFS